MPIDLNGPEPAGAKASREAAEKGLPEDVIADRRLIVRYLRSYANRFREGASEAFVCAMMASAIEGGSHRKPESKWP